MQKETRTKYRPLGGVEGFYLSTDLAGRSFIEYRTKAASYKIPIRPNGYTPKTGLGLCIAISSTVKGKRVLDIGTGETALAAIHCSFFKAKDCVAVDIDRRAITWARQAVKYAGARHVRVVRSNLYPSSSYGKFDVIISNPPQMPMRSRAVHDSGGADGLKYIIEILKNGRNHLAKDGKVIMTVFDFLTSPLVGKNGKPADSLKTLALGYGYKMKIIKKMRRVVRIGGETHKNLANIEKLYPGFAPRLSSAGKLYHYVFAIEFTLLK